MTATQRWLVLLVVYLLFLLIGIGALGAVLGFFPAADERFRQFAVATLFVDIAAAGITVFRTQFSQSELPIQVSLVFPGKKPADVSLSGECEFEIRDRNNVTVKTGKALVARGAGGWFCTFSLPLVNMEYAYARLTVQETNGNLWLVSHFALNAFTVHLERKS